MEMLERYWDRRAAALSGCGAAIFITAKRGKKREKHNRVSKKCLWGSTTALGYFKVTNPKQSKSCNKLSTKKWNKSSFTFSSWTPQPMTNYAISSLGRIVKISLTYNWTCWLVVAFFFFPSLLCVVELKMTKPWISSFLQSILFPWLPVFMKF